MVDVAVVSQNTTVVGYVGTLTSVPENGERYVHIHLLPVSHARERISTGAQEHLMLGCWRRENDKKNQSQRTLGEKLGKQEEGKGKRETKEVKEWMLLV
jgi:hypothetical protein